MKPPPWVYFVSLCFGGRLCSVPPSLLWCFLGQSQLQSKPKLAVYVRLLLQMCRHEASHLLSINKHSVHWMWGFDVYACKWSPRKALSGRQLPGKVRLAACFHGSSLSSVWARRASPVLNVQSHCWAGCLLSTLSTHTQRWRPRGCPCSQDSSGPHSPLGPWVIGRKMHQVRC